MVLLVNDMRTDINDMRTDIIRPPDVTLYLTAKTQTSY